MGKRSFNSLKIVQYMHTHTHTHALSDVFSPPTHSEKKSFRLIVYLTSEDGFSIMSASDIYL